MSEQYIKARYGKHLKVLDAIDKAIKDNLWQKSEFLKSQGRQLEKLREDFHANIGMDDYLQQNISNSSKDKVNRTGQMKVYLSLYNSDGHDMDKWFNIIKGISNAVVTRPVYRVADDVQALIRTKNNIENEGYIVVYVNNSALLAAKDGKPQIDSNGNEVILLKDTCIQIDNIIEFDYQKEQYTIQFGKLVLKKLP